MFCPKCGNKNPDDGKYCRSCGTDLGNISAALTGRLPNELSARLIDKKGKPIRWDGVISTSFTGFAFLIISIILGLSGSGRGWWFWMLIPAFAMIGTGAAQYVQLRKAEKEIEARNSPPPRNLNSNQDSDALPPSQTQYIAPESRYRTGDLTPPSVTEKTTNLLQHDSEGETMTLPKQPE